MNRTRKFSLITTGFCVILAFAASPAMAGCSDVSDQKSPYAPGALEPRTDARLVPASYLQVSSDAYLRSSIVGMWKFTMVAQGNTGAYAPPDGAVLDAGYAVWHSDGTEIMNSGRVPMTQSFCMGVWEQVGRASFKLNHFTLSWSADGKSFVGPGNIHESINVDDSGNSYTGTFAIDQYDATGATVLAHITGDVHATRLTVD